MTLRVSKGYLTTWLTLLLWLPMTFTSQCKKLYLFTKRIVTHFCLRHRSQDHYKKSAIDVTSEDGVKIEKIHGSQLEFEITYGIHPSSSIELEFKPEVDSVSGLVLASGDKAWEDMAVAFLHKGQVVFARQCGPGNVFEIYRKKIDDGQWHSLKFIHNERGGELYIDGERPFRQYHMGPCKAFTTAYIGGGLSQSPAATRWARLHEGFNGCIKNLKIDGRTPNADFTYKLVSQCQH